MDRQLMTHGARTGNTAREMCVAASQSIALTPGRAPTRGGGGPAQLLAFAADLVDHPVGRVME